MRVTDFIRQQTALQGVRTNLDTVSRAQRELASGRRVETVSDDPAAARQILQLNSQLREIESYRRTGVAVTTRLSVEDTVLTSVRNLLGIAKDLTVSGATPLPTDPDRQAALATVTQLRDQLLSLGNTRVGQEYLFAGGLTATQPFPPSGVYQGDTTVRQVEIDQGVHMATNHTGDQLFTPAIQALDALASALQTGTQTDVEAAFGALDAAQQGALVAQAETGARLRQIQDTATILATRSGVALDRRSALRDADPNESAVRLVTAQSALERAYGAIARVISSSLLDFLR